ncbi:MAG: response regulator [Candidatus Parabeggiatoa sp. nov. 3]|jgi:two-component system chemotaxis response regulator CheY|nr:MAG: response regulator [Gammaproteobacteria bacterium]RKZ64947.1 MAG: response regulator [Gammaproteobacteria bacterium]RKZ79182.1 MAG: response regulator [Gammaproteobacteria bacterium]
MSKTVVIVDDSKFLIKKIVAFFENEMTYQVVAQGYDGNDAVALYREHQPDLIALDITMPNKDGQQAMEEILAEFPDANILIISAVRGDTVLECMDTGAKGYIEKPLRFNDPEFIQDFKETLDEIFT